MTTLTTSSSRRDLYRELTEAVLESMRTADPTDWRPPWTSGRPENALTRNPYNGINILSLALAKHEAGYPTHLWASYRQWQKLDAQVRKGEKGTAIVYARKLPPPSQDSDTVENDVEKPRRVLKFSTVFNAAQVDGYTPPEPETPSKLFGLVEADRFIAITGAHIRWNEDHAYYQPDKDLIGLPSREAFTSTLGLYSTIFHELTHWTGAPHRLARNLKGRFGDHAYAAEELIAELGAHFLTAQHRIEGRATQDCARYLNSWIQLLENDHRAIFTASAKAAAAAEWLNDLVQRGGEDN